MSWDDSGKHLPPRDGPTTTVIDPDGTPNNILEESLGGSVKVDWAFSGPGRFLLTPTLFTVNLYAESIGPGPEKLVGTVNVPGWADTPGPTWNFTATIAIPPAHRRTHFPPMGPASPGSTGSRWSSPTPSGVYEMRSAASLKDRSSRCEAPDPT